MAVYLQSLRVNGLKVQALALTVLVGNVARTKWNKLETTLRRVRCRRDIKVGTSTSNDGHVCKSKLQKRS